MNHHVISSRDIDVLDNVRVPWDQAGTVCTGWESLIVHEDGGNPEAVSWDQTKKSQAKVGLVKVYQMFLNFRLLSFPIKYKNINYYNMNMRSFFKHYSYLQTIHLHTLLFRCEIKHIWPSLTA